jgi:hypothetical protein
MRMVEQIKIQSVSLKNKTHTHTNTLSKDELERKL